MGAGEAASFLEVDSQLCNRRAQGTPQERSLAAPLFSYSAATQSRRRPVSEAIAERKPLPTGTVTFLFSDIEGSTERWERHREAMRESVQRHEQLVRSAIESNNGVVFKTIGDAFCSAFYNVADAVAAALSAQR